MKISFLFGVVKLDDYGFITDFVKNHKFSSQIWQLLEFIISNLPKN